jgi:hypothetical protein
MPRHDRVDLLYGQMVESADHTVRFLAALPPLRRRPLTPARARALVRRRGKYAICGGGALRRRLNAQSALSAPRARRNLLDRVLLLPHGVGTVHP